MLSLATAAAACRGVASDVEVPEPLVFDLVRGLGAEAGELETNVLVVAELESGDPAAPEVAPEIEFAYADGAAVELELPFEDGGLYSVKTAGQWTLGDAPDVGFVHGVQAIAERLVDVDAWDLALLYVPAVRFDERWSALAMIGLGAFTGDEVADEVGVLANANVFHDLTKRWTLGLEVDTETFSELGGSVLLMPQAQWESGDVWTVQFGVGALYVDGSVAAGSEILIPDSRGWFPQAAVRLVAEF